MPFVTKGNALGTTITEGELELSDNTTNDASTTKHGFMKKLPNDDTLFYDGTGAFSAPEVANPGAVLPIHGNSANTNWDTVTANTGSYGNHIKYSDGNQNDAISWANVYLLAGDYYLDIGYETHGDGGIMTIKEDSNTIKDDLDTYSGSTIKNVFASVAFSVATSGAKIISITMASKNASASAYYGYITYLAIRPKAP